MPSGIAWCFSTASEAISRFRVSPVSTAQELHDGVEMKNVPSRVERLRQVARGVTAALLLCAPVIASAGDLDAHHVFAIPSQPVAAALLIFSEQAKIQVMTASVDLNGVTSPGISGDHTALEALEAILKGTG